MAYEITDLPAHLRASAMKQIAAQIGCGLAQEHKSLMDPPAPKVTAKPKPAPKPKPEAAAPADFASSGTHKPAHTRHLPGRMNGLEKRYSVLLDERIKAGEVAWWIFESVKFRLGDNVFYTPDFLVQLAGGPETSGTLQLHETKGWMREDAQVKVSVMKQMYPFPLFVCKWIKKEWEIKQA